MEALLVLEKKPSGVPRLGGTGIRENFMSSSKSSGSSRLCDLTRRRNARLLCP